MGHPKKMLLLFLIFFFIISAIPASAETEKRPIYLVTFKTQYELAATFMRFQEHYESPKFKGRIFSWEEYMDWYAQERGGFTYLQDWSGFNIPSSVLSSFYQSNFDPLTNKEKRLLDAFRPIEGDFYVIGVWQIGETL